jgi:hypothetical protein
MKGTVLRVVSGGAVAAALMTVFALPASAVVTPTVAPTVNIAFPTSGVFVRRGALWVNGVACDPNAAMTDSTAGISRVSVFLGDRDDPKTAPPWRPGGFLGSASLAGTNPEFSVNAAENSRLGLNTPDVSVCKNPTSGWRVLTGSLRKKGTYTMNVYVVAKNGKETRVTINNLRVDQP